MQEMEYVEVERFNRTQRVRALFTTRRNGCSQQEYASLNLGLHVGDRWEHVLYNRQKIGQRIGFPLERWVAGEQVHSDRVAMVGREDWGKGAFHYETSVPASDAMITREKGTVLSTYAADCVPMLLFDPVKEAIGVVHAGWRGTVLKVAKKAVAQMVETFSSRPEDIWVAIGPSIGPCCYEVDARVRDGMISSYDHGDRFFTEKGRGKWLFSLWEANMAALMEAGIKGENIENFALCTCCQNHRFYSYRKEAGKTGRHAGLIVLL